MRELGYWLRALRLMEERAQDVRFGRRMLVKSPVVSLVGIVTLALATGATTAIFSVVNGVVLRPLPFEEPERLVGGYEGTGFQKRSNGANGENGVVSH